VTLSVDTNGDCSTIIRRLSRLVRWVWPIPAEAKDEASRKAHVILFLGHALGEIPESARNVFRLNDTNGYMAEHFDVKSASDGQSKPVCAGSGVQREAVQPGQCYVACVHASQRNLRKWSDSVVVRIGKTRALSAKRYSNSRLSSRNRRAFSSSRLDWQPLERLPPFSYSVPLVSALHGLHATDVSRCFPWRFSLAMMSRNRIEKLARFDHSILGDHRSAAGLKGSRSGWKSKKDRGPKKGEPTQAGPNNATEVLFSGQTSSLAMRQSEIETDSLPFSGGPCFRGRPNHDRLHPLSDSNHRSDFPVGQDVLPTVYCNCWWEPVWADQQRESLPI
jgi:hypothetical protein